MTTTALPTCDCSATRLLAIARYSNVRRPSRQPGASSLRCRTGRVPSNRMNRGRGALPARTALLAAAGAGTIPNRCVRSPRFAAILSAPMSSRIEDYALIGNTRTAALVARDGSIDWLCAPRFDSRACFAALVGTPDNGRWQLAPRQPVRRTRRRYRDQTMILETDFETSSGAVRLIDCMPLWPDRTDLVRIVEGVRGHVPMRMELIIRCGYGA